MFHAKIDFSKTKGKVKPMHAVNNGPVGSNVRGTSNEKWFKLAGIPYARTHDSALCASYGGESIVDVHRIFKNFDADVNDPASYDFEFTDKYISRIQSVGCETFYRLGASIEHYKKIGTYPPKDFQKWAEICEHIILHYNEGWADGFNFGIKYWEIWNEPDCLNPDGSTPCWQSTLEHFMELFVTTFKHLKGKFPHLKIGGPALTNIWIEENNKIVFDAIKKADITIDFFSYHGYAEEPIEYYDGAVKAYELLKEYGYDGKTELNLNEWNYIHGWLGDEFIYSLKSIMGLKGAAFTASAFCAGQRSPLDMMMYYDARPSSFNGMFAAYTVEPLKGYYPFVAFNNLYKMEQSVESESDNKNLYITAAKGNEKTGAMVSYFVDDDNAPSEKLSLEIKNMPFEKATVSYYLLDKDHDLELIRKETVSSKDVNLFVDIDLYSTYYVEIEELK